MYVKNPIRFVSTFVTVTSGAFGMLLLDYVTMGLKTASNPEEIVGCILVCVQVLSLQNMNLPTFPSPFPFLAHLTNICYPPQRFFCKNPGGGFMDPFVDAAYQLGSFMPPTTLLTCTY